MRTAEKAALFDDAKTFKSNVFGRARIVKQYAEVFRSWGYIRDSAIVFLLHTTGAELVNPRRPENPRRGPDLSYELMNLGISATLRKGLVTIFNRDCPKLSLLDHWSEGIYEPSLMREVSIEGSWFDVSDFDNRSFVPSDKLARYVLNQMIDKQAEDKKISEMLKAAISPQGVVIDGEQTPREFDIQMADAKEIISTSIRHLANTIAESGPPGSTICITKECKLLTRVAEAILFRIPVSPYELGDFLSLLVKELIAAVTVTPIACGEASLVIYNNEIGVVHNNSQYKPIFDWAPEDKEWVKAT